MARIVPAPRVMILQFNHVQRKCVAETTKDVIDSLYSLLEKATSSSHNSRACAFT